MPGVLMLEAMAQTAGLLSFAHDGQAPGRQQRSIYFAGIDGARFKRPVEPGDQLVMDVTLERPSPASTSSRASRASARSGLRGRADVHHAPSDLKPSAMRASSIHGIVDAGADRPSRQHRPYSVIGPHVKIGAGTTVGPHCVIEGHTTIGRDNRIFQFGSIGAANQDKKYAASPASW
jgi:hypothetical protein